MTVKTPTATPKGSPDFIRLDGADVTPSVSQIALVPGALVTLVALELPKGLRGEAREQVARRQLNDLIRLGSDAVEMRPFYGLGGAENWSRVLVAGKADMARWRHQAGETCRAVLPDYLALPVAPDIWVVSRTPDGLAVRLGVEDGFSAAPSIAIALMDRAFAESGTPPKAILKLGAGLSEVDALAEKRNIPTFDKVEDTVAKVLANGELHFDLRKDPQAARARLRQSILPWRWVALAAMLAAGLWGASQVIASHALEKQRTQLDAATNDLVRAHFLPTGPILDVRVQVARALADLQSDSTARAANDESAPLALIGKSADLLFGMPEVETTSISYTAQNGLSVRVNLDDFSSLDRLIASFATEGLVISVAQSRATTSTTQAELQITAAEQ